MKAAHEPERGCQSHLRIDRLLAGELDAASGEEVERHARSCARCGRLLNELKRAQVAFSPVLPEVLVQRVHERQERRVLLAGRTWLAPLVAAAGLLLALTLWTTPLDVQEAGVRTKGVPQLTFYVLHDGVVRPGADGEHVQPGDQIQFAYTSPRDAYLAVVSIDAARKVNAYYAEDGRAAPLGAASHRVLDRSTRLDETLGPETLYVLLCDQAIVVAPLLRALERAPDRPPAASGCSVQRIALHKVAR
jgi:hypothetical protein